MIISDVYQGIIVGDDALKDEFGDPQIEPAIYGNIEPSANVLEVLKMPAMYRLYVSYNSVDQEMETEVTAAKARWNVQEVIEHGDEVPRSRLDNRMREPRLENKVDFTKLRATQLPFNKFINMPTKAPGNDEVVIQNQRVEMLNTCNKFRVEMCDTKGKPLDSNNLTKAQFLGLKEIREGVKNKGWVLYGSDKSGKLVYRRYY